MKEEHDNNYHSLSPKTYPDHQKKVDKDNEKDTSNDNQSLVKPKLPKKKKAPSEKPVLDPKKVETHEKYKNFWYQFRKVFHITYSTGKVLIITTLMILVSVIIFGAGTSLGYFAHLVNDMKIPTEKQLDKKLHQISEHSTMTYSDGKNIGTLQSDIVRTTISNKDIPSVLKTALIDTEDPDFYKHNGVVPKAIARALIAQVSGSGSISGGSTLTQQLVKQQLLTNETTFERKAKEILLAERVDKYFSKEDILTTYLNVTSFGRNNKGENIAGVEEAAQGIFGVKTKDLNLPQAAFIAGLPQSPIVYSPYNSLGELKSKENLQAGLARKDVILLNMYRHGDLTKKDYESAKNYDLTKDFLKHSDRKNKEYNYLYFAVKDEAVKIMMPTFYEQDGFTENDIDQSEELYNRYYEMASTELSSKGYTIKSTIDKDIYDVMQKTAKEKGSQLDEKNSDETVEVGNVLMDNQTGRIYGFVGGRNFKQNQNNHALKTKRSAASTMKPISTYAPALDLGLINSQTMINNEYFAYSNGKEVTNYGHSRGVGFESATDALKYSHNIPTLNLYKELLEKGNPYQYISDLDLGLSKKQVDYESSPLGTNDVTVVAQTGAFAALANRGVFNAPYMIESIKDADGKTVYQHECENKQVYKSSTASIMNEMMRKVINDKEATGYRVKQKMKKTNKSLYNGDWVGKTGTSEYNTDFWFIASTPSVTLSSWAGYDNNKKMSDHVRDANMDYWVDLAEAIRQTDDSILGLDEDFKLSSDVVKEKVAKQTGTKKGSIIHNGKKYTTPSDLVTAYATEKSAIPNATFEYGIGGTERQYLSQWKSFKK